VTCMGTQKFSFVAIQGRSNNLKLNKHELKITQVRKGNRSRHSEDNIDTVQGIAKMTGISKGFMLYYGVQYIGYYIPHLLTNEENNQRVSTAQKL